MKFRRSLPQNINTYYPKISGSRAVLKPSDIIGNEEFLIEPTERIPVSTGEFVVAGQSSEGSYLINLKKYPYRTSTGSRQDYSYQYDGESYFSTSSVNTFVLTNPRANSEYYNSFCIYKNLLISVNDVPRAIDLSTGNVVWDLFDVFIQTYEGSLISGFTGISHVTDDGVLYFQDWHRNSQSDPFYLYKVDVETGNYIVLEPMVFEESFLKPNGELILMNWRGNVLSILQKDNTLRAFPLTGMDEFFNEFYTDMHQNSPGTFSSSPDGSMYYFKIPYPSDTFIYAFDTETDALLWTKSLTSLGGSLYNIVTYHVMNSNRGIILAFIGPNTPAQSITLARLDWKTGEVLQTNDFFDANFDLNYDNACEYSAVSYHGDKFLLISRESANNAYVFDTETLSHLETTSFANLVVYGDFFVSTSNNVSMLLSESTLTQFDFETNSISTLSDPVKVFTSYLARDLIYGIPTPHEDGIFAATRSGSTVYLTNNSSVTFSDRKANESTPSGISGQALSEGWYYDNGDTAWKPPTFLTNFRNTYVKYPYDFGNGMEDSLLYMYPDQSYVISRFLDGSWQDYLSGTAPASSSNLLYNASISYNSGFCYPNVSEFFWPNIFNFVTEETITVPTVASRYGRGYLLGDEEYFFSSSSSSTPARKYNYTTNTWSTVAKLPAYGREKYLTSYNGDIYALTNDNISGTVGEQTIARKYTVATNTWSALSASLEGVVTYHRILYDAPYTIGELIYQPSSGYVYNMSTDTWSEISGGKIDTTVSFYAFNAGRIHYTIPYQVWLNNWSSKVNYSTAAYALPGAVAPY